MDYKINSLTTECLNISSFIDRDSNNGIELLINIDTNFNDTDIDNIIQFKISYLINAKNVPFYLNWVVNCILEFENKPGNDLNAEDFLYDEKIKNFIQNSIKNMSSLLNMNLPDIYELRKFHNVD